MVLGKGVLLVDEEAHGGRSSEWELGYSFLPPNWHGHLPTQLHTKGVGEVIAVVVNFTALFDHLLLTLFLTVQHEELRPDEEESLGVQYSELKCFSVFILLPLNTFVI